MGREHFVHFRYFQQVGSAERELAAHSRDCLACLFHAMSAKGDLWSRKTASSVGSSYLDVLPPAPPLPWPWLSEAAFDRFVAQYEGADPTLRFIDGLNSYCTADANWRGGQGWADHDVETPTLSLYGANDPSFGFFPDWEEQMPQRVPGLRGLVAVPEAGNFVQQEQPQAFNKGLLDFLDEVAR